MPRKIFSIVLFVIMFMPRFSMAEEATSTPDIISEPIVSTSTPSDIAASTTAVSDISSTTTVESSSTSTPEQAPLTTNSSTPPDKSGPAIISGDAVAMANILNLVNTNFVNSNGVILFSNFFDYIKESLDLRNTSTSLFDGLCLTDTCGGNNTSVNISNQAIIDNFLLLQALTGGNTIASSTATSTINTGDAYAGLNLINLANTNFVDSEYLLVTLNAFKGIEGDIIFPSLSNFFNSLRSSGGSVELNNEASLENNVSTEVGTGGNSVNDGNISTGSASSTTNIFNQLNTTLVGGANVSILFRVHGDWVGEIFGAPENLGWTQDTDGSIYLFDTSSGSTTAPNGSANTDVSGSNDALIRNNVTIMALTGNNRIAGPGTGIISTGNAVAGANIVNIANSNIIGRNWIMAIVNIFGDFKGNIAFGRPDLWVGEQISAPQDVYKDTVLEYKFTIINNGDSPANKIKLVDNYDADNLEILNSSFQYLKDENGDLVWDIGNLPPGKATEITYQARVIADGEAEATNSVSVSSHETDNNTNDNTDTASIYIKAKPVARAGGSRRGGSGSSGGSVLGLSADMSTSTVKAISILRLPPITTVRNKDTTVEQKLIITNPTGLTIKSAILKDILKDPTGEPIHTEVWNLGDILPHEEITVSYEVAFNENARLGFYGLYTRVESGKEKLNNGINGLILLGSLADLFPAPITKQIAKEKTNVAVVSEARINPSTDSGTVLGTQTPYVAFLEDNAVDKPEQKGEVADYLPLTASFALLPLLLLKLYQVFW